MVYVQDINGKPLMPTTRYGKVRRLLKDKKAVIKILDIKEGFALYEYGKSPTLLFSMELEDIVKRYVLITDVKHK